METYKGIVGRNGRNVHFIHAAGNLSGFPICGGYVTSRSGGLVVSGKPYVSKVWNGEIVTCKKCLKIKVDS